MRKIMTIGLFLVMAFTLVAPAEACGRRGHRQRGHRHHKASSCSVQATPACAGGVCPVK